MSLRRRTRGPRGKSSSISCERAKESDPCPPARPSDPAAGDGDRQTDTAYNAHFQTVAVLPALELALKQRLLGAVLLIFLGILVIPMLLDTQRPDLLTPLPEVAEPRELVFSHQPSIDLSDPVTRPMPEPETQAPVVLEPQEKWFIQVGRFKNADKATEIRDAMRQVGYPTDLYPQKTDGQMHQRIWVGPYHTHGEAEAALKGILGKKNVTDVHEGWVVRQP